MDPRTIAIVTLPGVITLDYSIAANILGEQPGYQVLVCGAATAATGVQIVPTHDLAAIDETDIVVVPGFDDPHVPPPDEYLDALARSFDRGATMVGICTGTFALAASGITDGRQVTAHWQYTAQLQELYPDTKVLENVLFVEDGNLLTSAGGGAGIDLCLHLIRSDHGVDAEQAAGKRFVAGPVRPGAHPQYIDALTPPRLDLARTRHWAMENLSRQVTVDGLARHSNMARRTFIRRFHDETGMSPMRWLTLQRVLLARRLLERSDWSVDRIADRSGMGTAANFRVLFRKETGLAPSEYRRLHRS